VVAHNGFGACDVIWRVVPLETPRVLRRCAQCRAIRPFASSEKFRLNAQQNKVDVWLVYKCLTCENTWNCTIISRRTAKEIGCVLYPRFQRNDRELAWMYAFDYRLLSQIGGQVDSAVPVRVERRRTNDFTGASQQQTIRLELPYPGIIRLDRLLAEQLRLSRSALQRWFDGDGLRVWPEEKNVLRKPARHCQLVCLHGASLVSAVLAT